jgi:hypothetical protein
MCTASGNRISVSSPHRYRYFLLVGTRLDTQKGDTVLGAQQPSFRQLWSDDEEPKAPEYLCFVLSLLVLLQDWLIYWIRMRCDGST